MTQNGGYTIEVDPDKLDELASGIGTAEMKCSFALSKLKWGMGSIAADIAGVGGGNINHLQEKFEGSIKKYKDLLDDSQAFVKKTAADIRQLDQSWQAKLGRTVGEFSGWYDLQRTFGEYDPQTGEKITGGQRAEAGVMTILNFSPGKAIGVFAKGGKMAKTAKIGQEASALGKIKSGRKAVNPTVFKDFFSGAWNSMKGRFRSAKEYIVKGKEAVKKVGDWQIPSLQKQLIGPNGLRLQNNPTVKEAGQYLYKTVKDGGQQVAKVVTEGSRAVKEGGAKVVRNVNNFNFGAYLRKAKGDPPAGMKRPHAHHVAVKGVFVRRKKIVRSYAEYGRQLLRDVDIDPIFGLENLHWAPNKGHSNAYIKAVTKELHRLKMENAPREEYVKKLEWIAEQLNDKGFPVPD
ncbi:pre-toxin TG domain-containing protein [Priestia endophytica]|uniref:pre-toxin TG domain-containing protein n=1 Tax=Priestia endophytica TaxID=135735 RepID=UPI00203F53DE|nr:pre-toxin TG domain-containing protein [Priestia endophytica]MCM3539105.1 pre-toxin TG domain-containing protein [Priestia endophytica]